MSTTESAGGVVVSSQGQVLVVSQHGTSWSLPKGHIEPEEKTVVAAMREIHEESGVQQLTPVKKLETYSRYKISADGQGEDSSELKVIHMFLFTTTQLDLKPIDPENPEARWMQPDEVLQVLTHPKDKEFYQSHLSEIKEFIKQHHEH